MRCSQNPFVVKPKICLFEDQRSFLSKFCASWRVRVLKYEHADVVHSSFLDYPTEFRKLRTFFDGTCGIVCDGLRHQEVEGKIQDFGGLLLWKWS
jgi:hypothetical protein